MLLLRASLVISQEVKNLTNAEYHKRFRDKRKALNRCVLCGTQDERTLAGRTRCYKCSEKQKIYDKSKRKSERKSVAKMKNLSISEIVRLATAEGLSYGKYVTKHREEKIT